MKTDQDYKTIDAMLKYGGSFVKKLGELAMTADNNNLQRIKDTWRDYWTQYTQMSNQK